LDAAEPTEATANATELTDATAVEVTCMMASTGFLATVIGPASVPAKGTASGGSSAAQTGTLTQRLHNRTTMWCRNWFSVDLLVAGIPSRKLAHCSVFLMYMYWGSFGVAG
jgi:hypothetical protein